MDLFKLRHPDAPIEVVDGRGNRWTPAPTPDDHGKPRYGSDEPNGNFFLTEDEVREHPLTAA